MLACFRLTRNMTAFFGLLSFWAVWGGCASVERPAPDGVNCVELVQAPLPAGAVTHIGGFMGQRLDANRDNLVKAFDIEHYLEMVERRDYRDWFWHGEHPGKWIESASLLAAQYGDKALLAEDVAALKRMEAAQEPSGYLGITDPAVRTPQTPLRGMDAYELYFTMHGLMTAYETVGDEQALESARKLADYFVATLGPGKAEFWPSEKRPPENHRVRLRGHSELAGHAVHYGWEGSLLNDPMLRLYQITGDRKYMDWARWSVLNLDRWGGWDAFSRLDDVAADAIGIDELQPVVHSHTFNMNFLGFLRMYRVTGDRTWFDKVAGAWEDIASRQVFVTGAVSVDEHYEGDHYLPLTGEMIETCADMSWMQLNQGLLGLSGDPKYADAIERLMLNHVFAAQSIDGDAFRYFTPLNGFKPEGIYRDRVDCCQGSGHRLCAMLPGMLYAQEKNGLVVNQYALSRARAHLEAGDIAVRVETNYPEGGVILIRIEAAPQEKCALKLRLPSWCEAPRLTLNSSPVEELRPGTYKTIERRWKAGDYLVLKLPMRVRWIEHTHWRGEGPAPVALMRGPLVYALDTVWWDETQWGPAPQNAGDEVEIIDGLNLTEEPSARREAGPFYTVKVRLKDGREASAVMVPFENIGRWYRDGETKPDKKSRAFSYAVWLKAAK